MSTKKKMQRAIGSIQKQTIGELQAGLGTDHAVEYSAQMEEHLKTILPGAIKADLQDATSPLMDVALTAMKWQFKRTPFAEMDTFRAVVAEAVGHVAPALVFDLVTENEKLVDNVAAQLMQLPAFKQVAERVDTGDVLTFAVKKDGEVKNQRLGKVLSRHDKALDKSRDRIIQLQQDVAEHNKRLVDLQCHVEGGAKLQQDVAEQNKRIVKRMDELVSVDDRRYNKLLKQLDFMDEQITTLLNDSAHMNANIHNLEENINNLEECFNNLEQEQMRWRKSHITMKDLEGLVERKVEEHMRKFISLKMLGELKKVVGVEVTSE